MYNQNNSLYHHGILGMIWGKRNGPPYPLRAQQLSATEKRLSKRQVKKQIKEQKKDTYYKGLTDEELKDHIERLKLENEYRSLSGLHISTGQKSTIEYMKEGGKEGLKEVSKKLITTIGGNYFKTLESEKTRQEKAKDREIEKKNKKQDKIDERAEKKIDRQIEREEKVRDKDYERRHSFNANEEISKYSLLELRERVATGKYTNDEVEKLNEAYDNRDEFNKKTSNNWNFKSGAKGQNNSKDDDEKKKRN